MWRIHDTEGAGLYQGPGCSNRSRGGGRGKRAGRVAGAVITGAVTLGQAVVEPQQESTNTQGNWADSSMETRATDSARTQRGATRDKGNQTGGSGQK